MPSPSCPPTPSTAPSRDGYTEALQGVLVPLSSLLLQGVMQREPPDQGLAQQSTGTNGTVFL